MQSPLHTLTHTAHPYTYLKISTNTNSSQLSKSLLTNICKYPHSTCHNPYNNNCHNPYNHNPYNQNSILTITTVTILTIKIQSLQSKFNPYNPYNNKCHNTTFEDSRPLCAGHGAADAL